MLCFPVWNFGPPAMLKGFLDRVLVPGVAFELGADGSLTPTLRHIRKLAAVTSYGRPRWVAWLMGDPPRKLVKRQLRHLIRPGARVRYLAHYAIERLDRYEPPPLPRAGRADHGEALARDQLAVARRSRARRARRRPSVLVSGQRQLVRRLARIGLARAAACAAGPGRPD